MSTIDKSKLKQAKGIEGTTLKRYASGAKKFSEVLDAASTKLPRGPRSKGFTTTGVKGAALKGVASNRIKK